MLNCGTLARDLAGLPTKQHKVTMILDLAPDVESQWRVFNAKLRNQIRKAEKSDLQPVIGQLRTLGRLLRSFCPKHAGSWHTRLRKMFFP